MIGPLLGSLVALLGAQSSPDIGPIIQSHCVSCHRDGGDGPFSLETADDVRRRASMIATVTESRFMPPWKPAPGFGEFQHARRMTDAEIGAIAAWVKAGAPASSLSGLGRRDRDTRQESEPDLTIALPSFVLPAAGADVFRNFVVSIPIDRARFVRGLQFRPRSRAVHHANIRIDATAASRRLDEADPLPGYEGMIARSADFPDGQFLGWTPGQLAPVLADDTAWRLSPGSDLVVQLHLRPTGAVETIAPTIALYFGDRGPAVTPIMIRLGKQDLDIPAGAPNQTIIDSFDLPADVAAVAIQPHAHYRARSVDVSATLPNGSRRPLLRITDWDVGWQDRYVFARPMALPAGTRITSTYVFDNSAANTRNPIRPPERARWGWRSSDEMGDVWIQVTTTSIEDRERVRLAITQKMLREDAIGSEVLLQREPSHVLLRNDAAQIYMALGEPGRALAHFAAVSSLEPRSPAASFNEGTALEALGRNTDARLKYEGAIALDPRYSPALNNLGAMLLREGRITEARARFDAAVAADRANADAQANLGLAMIAAGESDAGLAHLTEAIDLKPDLLPRMTPHAWLLAAHADAAARRPAAALALAERIAAIHPDRAAALDLLAACQAAAGSFDLAVQTASAALSAAPASSDLRSAIRARLERYHSRRPFVLDR